LKVENVNLITLYILHTTLELCC